MPTILTHAALPLIAAWGLGPGRVPPAIAWAAAVVAIVPDFDVLGRFVGIPVESIFGHRGASHSIAAAALLALLAVGFIRADGRWQTKLGFLYAAALSHGVTDMLTDGGKGIALLWPVNDERMFAPFRPIEVSPILLRGLETGKLPAVLASEFVWLILPGFAVALLVRRLRVHHIDLHKGQS